MASAAASGVTPGFWRVKEEGRRGREKGGERLREREKSELLKRLNLLFLRFSLVRSLSLSLSSRFKTEKPTTGNFSPYQPREAPSPDGQRRQDLQRERLRLHGVPLRRRPRPLPPLRAQEQEVGGTTARGLADAERGAERGVEGRGVEVGSAEELGVAVVCIVSMLEREREREKEKSKKRERREQEER